MSSSILSSWIAKKTTPGIAIVTGASSGIGRAASVALGLEGWTCVLVGRRQAELEETAQLIKTVRQESGLEQIGVAVHAADLGKPEEIESLFARVKADFGRLDLLFNNAGVNAPKIPLEQISLEQVQSVLNINVLAPYLCTQAAFRIMKDQSPQGGRIINNGSISAYTPRPFSAPYTMSKHAVAGLTKSTSLDGRAYNIACTQLDIGNAASAMSSAKTSTGSLQPNGQTVPEPIFDLVHAGKAVAYMASLPLEVNVLNQTLMATAMPFVGRG